MDVFMNYPSGNTVLNITKRGKKISSVDIEKGYNKRDMIGLCRQKGILGSIPFIERIEPDSSMHYALCFCLMVEKAMEKKCDDNVTLIRTLLMEIERTYSHINYLNRVFSLSNNATIHNMISAIRESIIDLKEEITGHRLYSCAHTFGGFNLDFSSGNLTLIEKKNNEMKSQIDKIKEILEDDGATASIYRGLATMNVLRVDPKLSGPFSWMNDINKDLRVSEPYLSYGNIDISSILKDNYTSKHNCALARIKAIMNDIENSIKVIQVIANERDLIYQTNDRLTDDIKVPRGVHDQKIETPRGLLEMSIGISKDGTMESLEIISPSDKNQRIISNALNGVLPDHLQVAWESLYISMMEIDK